MIDFVSQLEEDFELKADENIARKQMAYLKDQFKLYGLPTPVRKEVQKPFLLRENMPSKEELTPIIKELWQKPQREFQYFAIDLNRKYLKQLEKHDIQLFELMIKKKSWWDTVDLIASNLVGGYFKTYPEQIIPITNKWIKSENMWLQRTCLIFQLKYKEEINTELLTKFINRLLGSNEFFINKAIGWILREYSRTNQNWVIDFVKSTDLNNLSKREALKLIKNK